MCGHPSRTTIPPAPTNTEKQIAALLSPLLISAKQLIWLWRKKKGNGRFRTLVILQGNETGL